jgi:hypothetical protein
VIRPTAVILSIGAAFLADCAIGAPIVTACAFLAPFAGFVAVMGAIAYVVGRKDSDS